MNEYRDQPQDKDWERISELLLASDCVPEAPDCRSAVMARISRRKPVRKLAWAYGLGAVVLAVVAVHTLQPGAPVMTKSSHTSQVAQLVRKKFSTQASAVKPKTPRYDTLAQASPPLQSLHRVASPRQEKPVREKPVMVAMKPPSTPIERRLSVGDNMTMNDAPTEARATAEKVPTSASDGASIGREMKSVSAKSIRAGLDSGTVLAYAAKPMPADMKSARAARDRYYSDQVASADADKTAPVVTGALAATPARAANKRDVVASAIGDNPVVKVQSGWYRHVSGTTDGTAGTPLGIANDKRPVAVAVVTWPSRHNTTANSYSYGYTDRDAATGVTTECRVKRSGDAVEIYLESKPAAKEPPVKGSVEHETKPSA